MQAILITAYKNIEHLKEIVTFFDDRFSIYIHIDKKSRITKQQIQSLKAYKNVYYTSQNYNIYWGGINHLLAILEIAKEALKETSNSYFHLITGHDYPIKEIDEFVTFEKKNNQYIFMENHKLPYKVWADGGLDRLEYYNLYDLIDGRRGLGEFVTKKFIMLQKLFHIKRSFSSNFSQLYGGSTYWSMNRDALKYTFDYISDNGNFLNRFKYSFCSEELFFQTILMNSPLNTYIKNDNKRFIVWEKRNGNYPANLDISDLSNINSSDALFARKFEYPVSEDLLRRIKDKLQVQKKL